jgi:flavin-dependent thymidylate synthase
MKNKVELLGWYGGDEINACSAWTSTSRNLTPEKRARIPKLLKDLASAGHETPFEKSIVHFLVDTEIASHIHLLKHRISSLNAESARYKELKEDKYYIPDDWNGLPNEHGFNAGIKRTDNIKFGDSDAFNWSDTLLQYTELGNKLYHACLKDLEPVLGRKRAKESARFFKTYNSQIQADVMFNWRSFVNFQKLRNSEHAQKEIREIAAEMLKLVKEIPEKPFQHTIAAFNL